VIILQISKILVVIRFHTFAKMVVYICHQMQNSAGTILQFELYPPLFTYNVEFYSSSNVNMVEWLVSRPEVPNLGYMYP